MYIQTCAGIFFAHPFLYTEFISSKETGSGPYDPIRRAVWKMSPTNTGSAADAADAKQLIENAFRK